MLKDLYIFIPKKGDVTGLDFNDLKESYQSIKIITFDETFHGENVETILIPKKFQMVHLKQFWIRDYILSTPEGIYQIGFKNKESSFNPPLLSKIFENTLDKYPVAVEGGEIISYKDKFLTSSKDYYEYNKNKLNIYYIKLNTELLCMYHLDLVVNMVDEKRVLMSNPFILEYYKRKSFSRKYELEKEFNKLLNQLESLGFTEIIQVPMTLRENINSEIILEKDDKTDKSEIKIPMNSLINGLWANKNFYYSWMDIRDKELELEILEKIKNIKGINFKPVELKSTVYDLAGGIRCLSNEIIV
jgi:hypothetical protein